MTTGPHRRHRDPRRRRPPRPDSHGQASQERSKPARRCGPLDEPPEVNERNLWIGARVIAGHHDPVLRGVRVRLLLPALAQQQRPVATGGCRPAAEVRPRDRPPVRRRAPGLLAYAAWAARQERGWLAAAGAALALGARRLRGAGVRVRERSTSARPTAATRACSSAGPSSSSSSSLLTMYWVEILFAEGLRNRECGGGVRAGRAGRRRVLLGPAGGHRRCSPGRSSTCSEPCPRRRCPSAGPPTRRFSG